MEINLLSKNAFAQGQCSCGYCQYDLLRKPLFVHACHCTWCQKETGTAFALNALIERSQLVLKRGVIQTTKMPSLSGFGQQIIRCKQCYSALWSHYGSAREAIAFVRVGTLLNPQLCPADIHIFTSSKLPWVAIEKGTPAVLEYFDVVNIGLRKRLNVITRRLNDRSRHGKRLFLAG